MANWSDKRQVWVSTPEGSQPGLKAPARKVVVLVMASAVVKIVPWLRLSSLETGHGSGNAEFVVSTLRLSPRRAKPATVIRPLSSSFPQLPRGKLQCVFILGSRPGS
jgi:hypothetical protein